ncbi:hypothetical protein G4Y79_05190 [Phototrophicus methaneseepsis]|uniref:Uncharacterized protein n=1 Tax=Phototrophicus methaneseepsis TaxID=2710758 RepID=A0A7S8IEK6_9CHLR|nr:hypothetical protein [Phototrophicus methaneseepsis]QPC83775.1 hypothetical protein G4Y79_05190 [Phototrophicus methaneseepsis]
MPNLSISKVRLVEKGELMTWAAAETLVEGNIARLDANGKATGANATTAAEGTWAGIVTDDTQPGVVEVAGDGCLLYLEKSDGTNALADMNPGDHVYLSDTDKTLADATGTETITVGEVSFLQTYGGGTKLFRVRRQVIDRVGGA